MSAILRLFRKRSPRVARSLPVLAPAPLEMSDPATFPCAFLSMSNVDLRADR